LIRQKEDCDEGEGRILSQKRMWGLENRTRVGERVQSGRYWKRVCGEKKVEGGETKRGERR
jgi:hypothetical protein